MWRQACNCDSCKWSRVDNILRAQRNVTRDQNHRIAALENQLQATIEDKDKEITIIAQTVRRHGRQLKWLRYRLGEKQLADNRQSTTESSISIGSKEVYQPTGNAGLPDEAVNQEAREMDDPETTLKLG